MELLEGLTINEFIELRANEGIIEDHVKMIISRLLPIVEFMHSKGVVHRDFNPNNIFLTNLRGDSDLTCASVKIIDFNIS
jgi:serine/threonine-protein kinase